MGNEMKKYTLHNENLSAIYATVRNLRLKKKNCLKEVQRLCESNIIKTPQIKLSKPTFAQIVAGPTNTNSSQHTKFEVVIVLWITTDQKSQAALHI